MSVDAVPWAAVTWGLESPHDTVSRGYGRHLSRGMVSGAVIRATHVAPLQARGTNFLPQLSRKGGVGSLCRGQPRMEVSLTGMAPEIKPNVTTLKKHQDITVVGPTREGILLAQKFLNQFYCSIAWNL